MRRLLFLVLLLFLPLPSEAQDRRIIDMHLHALPVDALPVHYDTVVGYERPGSAKAMMRKTIDQLERFNVVQGVTSGPQKLVDAYKKAAPERVIRSLWIPIGLTGDELRAYLDSLPSWYDQGRFQVLGEVLTQYSGLAPDDSILDPLWSFAERADVPVGIHMGPGFGSEYRVRNGNPLALEEVLAKHPNLRVYVMHAGYPQLEEMIGLLNTYPQVYVDLSGLPLGLPRAEVHRYLRRLVQAGYGDRILFGSDQMVWPQSYEKSVGIIESADFLTEEQKRAIFYDNAARFFGLEAGPADSSQLKEVLGRG